MLAALAGQPPPCATSPRATDDDPADRAARRAGPRCSTCSPSTRSASPTRASCAPPPSAGSILELARAIGYELNPGVAASTCSPSRWRPRRARPPSAAIPVGTKAQSIPGQDEQPQIFETVEAIEARAAWNALRVRSRETTSPARATSSSTCAASPCAQAGGRADRGQRKARAQAGGGPGGRPLAAPARRPGGGGPAGGSAGGGQGIHPRLPRQGAGRPGPRRPGAPRLRPAPAGLGLRPQRPPSGRPCPRASSRASLGSTTTMPFPSRRPSGRTSPSPRSRATLPRSSWTRSTPRSSPTAGWSSPRPRRPSSTG